MDPIDLGNTQLNNKIAFGEILNFPAHFLPQLSLPTTLIVEAEWWKTPVVFVVNSKVSKQARACGYPVFDGEEFALIVRGVENDRVWSTDLRSWCNVKKRDPAWRLEKRDVMDGVVKPDEPGWALERVLKRIEAKLLSLEVAQDH